MVEAVEVALYFRLWTQPLHVARSGHLVAVEEAEAEAAAEVEEEAVVL